ncbi:MAG: AI-2E family transporter [Clostridia bacterium]|nr:AI-2E family transporter [Clostridia bacterium]
MELQKNKGYKAYFFAAIAVAIVGILLYAIVNIDSLKAFINRLMLIFGPVIYGFCIAYLCNPIMKVFDNYVFKKIKFPGLRRALSLTMTVIVVLLGISVVIGLLVPEIIRSIQHLFANYDSYLEEVIGIVNGFIIWLEKMIGYSPAENAQYISVEEIKEIVTSAVNSVFDSSKSILQQITEIFDENSTSMLKKVFEKLFPYTGTLINKIYVFIIDAFFSILIALHLLATKETRLAQIKKMRKSIFTYEQNKFINRVLKIIHESFGNYLEGKLLDALIIFALCWASFAIFGISDYNLLIAALIGITDIIPIVGPFIGAIPGGFIILITNPSKFLLYVILVLLIQQLEGNIISPKILGQHMGVSALCVLISIVVMGTIFDGNPIALIISVPLFAVMVELGKMFLESRLKKKGLPTDTAEYYRGEASEDEIDLAFHYQNRKLAFYYEHSKIKKWVDQRRDKKQQKKQEIAKAKAENTISTDVTDADTTQEQEMISQDNQNQDKD